MSKASDWIAKRTEWASNRPRFESPSLVAVVTDSGEMSVHVVTSRNPLGEEQTKPTAALALAAWITDTFGDVAPQAD